MPEWWLEQGIGETRAVLVDNGRIAEARILLQGVIPAGTVVAARLKSAGRHSVAVGGGQEYLLPKGAPGISEGGRLNIEVTREALGGTEPWKRPLARLTDESPRAADRIAGREVSSRELDDIGWLDLIEEARSGIVRFAGGELRISPTPAMTLIDVDGHLPAAELAIAGARAAAEAIRRHGIGGSIGIDLPTVEGKAGRQAAADAFDAVLPKPFERTAVNGFGFLQIVRPRTHASLFELAADRVPFEARALLRAAMREVGAVRLAAHPAVVSELSRNPGWLDQLSRRTGGLVTLREDASLAISAGHAEPS